MISAFPLPCSFSAKCHLQFPIFFSWVVTFGQTQTLLAKFHPQICTQPLMKLVACLRASRRKKFGSTGSISQVATECTVSRGLDPHSRHHGPGAARFADPHQSHTEVFALASCVGSIAQPSALESGAARPHGVPAQELDAGFALQDLTPFLATTLLSCRWGQHGISVIHFKSVHYAHIENLLGVPVDC